MSHRVLGKSMLGNLVRSISKEYRVCGPVARRTDVSFQEVDEADRMKLDYVSTTMPPKKFFHHREVLIEYDEEGYKAPNLDQERPLLLFGVHSCDLNAILRQDSLFKREREDSYYLRRRENSAIIALTCLQVGENCFCRSLGTGPTIEKGFDLLLTDLGERFLVEVGTPRGEGLVNGLRLPEASYRDLEAKRIRLHETETRFVKRLKMDGLADVALGDINHEVWDMIGEKGGLAGCFPCLSCGNCSLVCPTCYCYEVTDMADLTLRSGARERTLDSCQLLEYAEVALGGNFRSDRRSRIRHWMTCKFGGAGGQADSGCVGCGRCIHACPSRIDITEVAKALRGGST